MDLTQNRLSTGNKVNSAIDNPSSYYTAQSLNNCANDLLALFDSMGQAISTIKAATTALDTGLAFLDQATSITEQALSEARLEPMRDKVELIDNSEQLSTSGYTKITNANKDQLATLLTQDNAKIVLGGDIDFSGTALTISGANVIINGGGHELKCNSITISGANANVSNIEIESSIAGTTINIANTATDFNIDNIRVINTGVGYQTGINVSSSGKISNVSIDISDYNNNRNMGILAQTGSNVEITNLHLKQNAKDDCIVMSILTTGGTVSIDGMSIESTSKNVYGAIKYNGGTITGVTFPTDVKGKVDYPESWFDGEANTKAILAELKDGALAAKACNDYSVGTAAEFAQGTWYLPSMGELMEMYGYNYDAITDAYSTSGATHTGRDAINATLNTLKNDKGVDAAALSGYLWSSSELHSTSSWLLSTDNGDRGNSNKTSGYGVRSFNHIENAYTVGDSAPEVGDVYYTDNTWGKASAYDPSKTIAGVGASVGDDGSVKIMSLKNIATTKWSTTYTDVEVMDNLDFYQFHAQIRPDMAITADEMNKTFSSLAAEEFQEQYNEVLAQYDNVVQDASYKGINLLQNDSLKVRFNEDGASNLEVTGKDVKAQKLGLNNANWQTYNDISKSIAELKSAISSLRSYTTDLGNNYSIVMNREEFTENLINVLTEGADKLTLADMNEESANMLALQTRQHLAINSLSLASQASKSVLKLF